MTTKKAILILSLAGLGFSSAAFAQNGATGGDRSTYSAAKKQADANYKAAKSQCDAMGSRIQKENCIGIAKAEQRLAKANAQAQYKPTDRNQMKARMAVAEVDYAKAKAQCEATTAKERQTGTEADICLNKAAQARNQAVANAKAGKQAAEGDMKAPGSTMDTRGDIGKK